MTKPSPALVLPMKKIVALGAKSAIAIPVITGVAFALGQSAVAWGVALGGGIPALFFFITAWVGLGTAATSAERLGAIVLGSWLLKIIALIAVLAWLKGQDFYDKGAFFVTLMVTVIGVLTLEAMVVLKTKVPYVDPE